MLNRLCYDYNGDLFSIGLDNNFIEIVVNTTEEKVLLGSDTILGDIMSSGATDDGAADVECNNSGHVVYSY
jgi:hypothetical protein